MYSEVDAKTKWCPKAMAMREDASTSVGGVNRFNRQPDIDCMCIGSACMAWRWVHTKVPVARSQESGWAIGLKAALMPTTFEVGYCGAFGEPSGAPKVTAEVKDAK
jgi:hypothetical protein